MDSVCYCDENYTRVPFLKHKGKQLFLIETDAGYEKECLTEQTEEAVAGDIAQISVNAVAGISGYRTMRVRGNHGENLLFILTDWLYS